MSKPSPMRVTSGPFLVASLAAAVAVMACGGSGGGNTGGGGVAGPSGAAATGSAGTTGVAGTGAARPTGAAGNTGAIGSAGQGGVPGPSPDGGAGTSASGRGDASPNGGGDADGDVAAGPFALTSSAFSAGTQVPLPYKCTQSPPAGANMTPPLSWTPGPPGTRSYAVTLNHMAADDSAHWAMWDIPLATTSLPANIEHVAMPPVPAGAKQAQQNLDGFVGIGYQGPCPQAANQVQRYVFTVWAIGAPTVPGVTSASTTVAAQAAIQKAALPGGSATLVGTQLRTP